MIGFPIDPNAPDCADAPPRPMNGTLHALPSSEDPMIAITRDILIGASTMGFAGVVIVGLGPRNQGATVIGSPGMNGLQILGTLELAKSSALRRMEFGPTSVPPGAPGGPPLPKGT